MFGIKKMQWIALFVMATSMSFADENETVEMTPAITMPANDEVATQNEPTAEADETPVSFITVEESVACAEQEVSGDETSSDPEEPLACEATEPSEGEIEVSTTNVEVATLLDETSSTEIETQPTDEGIVSVEALGRVVNVNTMTDDDLLAAVEGNAVLEFPTASQLALQLFVDGDFLSFFGFTDELGFLEVQETFYLGFPVGGGLVFSSNLNDWRPFFDFTGGDLSVFLAKEDENIVLNVDLLLNKRSA